MKKLLPMILIVLLLAACATPMNYQAKTDGYLPTAEQFWELTFRAAESKSDPRYKYIRGDWSGWAGYVDCKQISREFATFLLTLEPTWPIGIAQNYGHVVVCCVTSDEGLVYFDQSKLRWTGLKNFFAENVYIRSNLDWPVQ